MEGVMQGEGMLDKIDIVHIEWACQTPPFFEQHQWQTVEYCHRKYASEFKFQVSEEMNITNAVYSWMDEGTLYRLLHILISQD